MAVVGWPDSVEAHTRLEQLETYLKSSFATFRPLSYNNEYKGPYTNRTLGNAAYANFSSSDEVREFLEKYKASDLQLEVRGSKLRVVQARTKLRKSRNWA